MNFSSLAQIKEWDWHYRVGFDSRLAKKVSDEFVRVLGLLGSIAERRELSAYQEFVSVDCMVNCLIDEPRRAEEFLEAIRGKLLLYLPPECAEKIYSRVVADFVGDQQSLLGIKEVVERAACVEYVNLSKDLVEFAIGDGFLSLAIDYLNQHGANSFSDSTNWMSEPEKFDDLCIEECINSAIEYGNKVLLGEQISRPDWKMTLGGDLACFAEYWPSLITGHQNELILGKVLETAKRADVIGSIIHEIGGHACFYHLVSSGYFSFLDHGAICLIEGWATWCEWYSPLATEGYKASLRYHALNSLKLAKSTSSEEAIKEIRGMELLNGDHQLIEQAVMNFHQYPCYSLSYYAGAVYFELESKKRSSDRYWKTREGEPLTNILRRG